LHNQAVVVSQTIFRLLSVHLVSSQYRTRSCSVKATQHAQLRSCIVCKKMRGDAVEFMTLKRIYL